MSITPIKLARYYVSKHKTAKERGLEFTLSLSEVRKLMERKRCYYTGIELTTPIQDHPKHTDRTLERIDNTKGYVSKNVVAVCHAANQLKARWEDPQNPLTLDAIKKMVSKL